MAVKRPAEPIFVFEALVFSTADIERSQFIQISGGEEATPTLMPSTLEVESPSAQISSGKQINGR